MSSWQDKAIKALEDSLHPVPQELNTIDWKCALSDKSERLAQHICAFSNTANGGFLAFGFNDDTTFASLSLVKSTMPHSRRPLSTPSAS